MGHVRKVIQLLCEKILYARMSKCQFANTKLHYIAHVVGRVDPCKIETVQKYTTLQDLGQSSSFLWLCNYFKRFI